MQHLWLYACLSRLGRLNYRMKIMVMAFIGTHVPLIALVGYAAAGRADWHALLTILGVALVATLLGTAATLVTLHHLLRPVTMTAEALRAYRTRRVLQPLPTHFTDDAGALMADASATLTQLDVALDRLQFIDEGSGLPNRKRLVDDLAASMARGAPVAVCAARFGAYQRVADALDLAAAEDAAREVAGRIKAALPVNPRLYRVDAQAFVFLLDRQGSGGTHQEAGARLAAILGVSGQDVVRPALTLSPDLRGGVVLCPDDASDPDTLIDHALAAASGAGDALAVGFHSPVARRVALDRLVMEQDCRRALRDNEFVLHYQPVVDLAAGRVVGAEALIRWQHPTRGLIPPGQFIGMAESTGLIDPIGRWVLRKACMQVREWSIAGDTALGVAVNLSARQLLDPELIGFVDEAIVAAGISADRLEIELTETAAMSDHTQTRLVFSKLRDLGVRIAIDDFGTGYASMSHLRKLPFDKLKIDREFVTDVHTRRDSQAICHALVALAEGLGLSVLAEGTETAEEVQFLRSAGCRLYQGYVFARPVEAARFALAMRDASQAATLLRVPAGTAVAAPLRLAAAG